MNNCYISCEDRFRYYLMTSDEVYYLFGDDWLEDMGSQVPQEIIDKWIKLNGEILEIENQLEQYKKESDKLW